jgi:hypothetical protein
MRITRQFASLAAVAALVLTGCSQAAEELTEEAIKQGGGGDVEIDADDGTVKVEGEDGSFTIGGKELPENFPSQVSLPDGGTVESASTVTTAKEEGWFVQASYPDASAHELAGSLAGAMKSGGFKETSSSSFNDQHLVGYDGHGYDVAAVVLDADGGGSTLSLTVSTK